MRELIEFMVRSLVAAPDQVEVTEVDENGETVLEIAVAEDDLGRIIGRGGRVAGALRALARAAAAREGRRVHLVILDD